MIANLLGGIGLFLLGMILLTDGLKAVAGDALRRILGRFVRGRFSALASGAAVTVLVQSSSATTLTTIGFVSAGILAFPQAVGVIFGASLGTTSTGWIVSLLGLKVSIGRLALPLVGAGALLRLLGRDRVAAGGLALAGFGLIFVGIDVLQVGMQHLAEEFDPGRLPGETIPGRLLLVATGIAMTVVMQSSSAAVATTLTALHSGALGITQAAALVVGQSVGTTVTAALACVGASTQARRTAVAHIAFNASTAAVAFAVLPVFVTLATVVAGHFDAEPGAVALAAFHTGFTALGILIFLPWADGFARMIERLVPERGPVLTSRLDATVAGLAPLAIAAARLTLRDVAGVLGAWTEGALRHGRRRVLRAELDAAGRALREVRVFLAQVRTDPETAAEHVRHLDTLHALDHLERLHDACNEGPPVLRPGPTRREAIERLLGAVTALAPWLSGADKEAPPVGALNQAFLQIAELRRAQRVDLLAEIAAGHVSPEEGLEEMEAMRWVDRLSYHLWRVVHHLAEPAAPADVSSGPSPGQDP